MKKAIRKAAVLGLSATLALTSLAGCSKKKETFDTEAAAITVDEDTISAGVVNFAVRYTQASVESLYQSLGVEDPFNEDLFGTGSTLGEQAKSQVVTTLTEALLAEQHMEDYGVTVTDEDKENISAAAARFIADNDESILETLFATQEIVERYLELCLVQARMEEQMTADVDTEVSDEEAAQRKIQYVIFAPVTETEEETETETEELYLEEESEEPEEQAETETADLTDNDSVNSRSADETQTEDAGSEEETVSDAETETEIETEIETQTEAETEDPETVAARERAYVQAREMLDLIAEGYGFEEAAEELGKTVSENTFGSDYSLTELVEATDGLEDGTVVDEPILVSTGSYYVVNLVTQLDREATDEEKENIVEERREECLEELYDEWTEAVEVSTDEEILEQIVFDYYLAEPEEAETEAGTEAVSEEAAKETEAVSDGIARESETE